MPGKPNKFEQVPKKSLWEWNTSGYNIPIKFIKDLRNNLFQTLKEYPDELIAVENIFGFFDEALVRTLLEDQNELD